MDLEVLTIWPQEYCSSPQTSEQPAVTTLGVQVEFVRVTWLPDPLRLLHPDANTHRSPLCHAMITYFRAHITEYPSCGCAHLSAISWLLVWKTRHTQTSHQSLLTTLSARGARRPPQTPDIRGLWKWLSPPAERRQRASACAPAWNVFATDSPELGSSGLCGSGGTAPPAPPLCAPPPGDAAPPLPGLRVLRWSERGPAPSSRSPQSRTKGEHITRNYKHFSIVSC